MNFNSQHLGLKQASCTILSVSNDLIRIRCGRVQVLILSEYAAIVFNWPSSSCMHTCPIQQRLLPCRLAQSSRSHGRSALLRTGSCSLSCRSLPPFISVRPSVRTHGRGRQLLLIPSRKPIILSPSLAPSVVRVPHRRQPARRQGQCIGRSVTAAVGWDINRARGG